MTAPILQVADLTVAHGGLVAVDQVSFDVGPAQIVGLIGPNGAGKTTCIDTLTGFTAPRHGHITFLGEPVDQLPAHQRARRGLVRTFQSLELFDDLTVRENLAVASSTPTWRETFTDLFRPKPTAEAIIDDVLADLDLASVAGRRPDELSNGQRHLVALARGLVARPQLLLLDEPAAGLDPSETVELREVLRALPGRGISVFLVDHDMSLVLGLCDVIHVLDFGSLIASGTPAQIRSDPAVISAYLGRSEHPS